MRILQATSEFHPYSKTGGLADMVAGLSGALVEQGHEITVATPLYLSVINEHRSLKPYGRQFQVALGKNVSPGQWYSTKTESGVTVLFLENKESLSIWIVDNVPCFGINVLELQILKVIT